ncbi:MAG: energy-coupling factor ABC transporter substrate-binding protein [Cellulosilyticaceae bacterium]
MRTPSNVLKTYTNSFLILVVMLLSLIPLWIQKDAAFGGADGEAETVISEINEGYSPWFRPLMEPASGEIESLFFAVQAAAGASVIAYGFGYLRGKSKKIKEESVYEEH